MKQLRGMSALAVTLTAALVLSGCGGDSAGGGGGGDVDRSGTTAKGNNGDGTYTAPVVSSGPEVVFTHDAAYTSYNNKTADGANLNNTLVLNQVLTDPFFLDGTLEYLLNTDVMESVKLTSEDPQVVTYKIKPDVRWSDGAAWDCDDFYLAWLSMSGKPVKRDAAGQPLRDAEGAEQTYFLPASTVGVDQADAECVDDLTFVETYQTPFPDWKGNYVQRSVLPAHIVEQQTGVADLTQLTPNSPDADLQRVADFWNTRWNGFTKEIMPGSGPYMIDSWEQNASVTLVRNPEWSGKPGGPERIVLRNIADGSAQAQGLQNRDFSVIAPQADPVVAERLRGLSAEGVVFAAGGGLTFEHLDPNFANPIFQDKAVRQAFAQCVDRDELVDKLVRGVDPQAQPLGSLLFTPDETDYEDFYSDKMPGDPSQAKQTLEGAGWALGPDGVYTKGDQRLSFRISHTILPRRVQTVQLIQSSCREAGMDIQDDSDPNFLDTRLSQGDYDVALYAWVGTPQKSSPASIYQTGGGQNTQRYTNPEVDRAWDRVKTEFDESARIEALKTADRTVADDFASLPLFQVPNMWAYSDTIDSVFYQGSDGPTWNANEWEVD
ncbi:MAG: ABC transporter family substrate-binding protein [Pseudonocardiaceae bacterium]